MLPITYLLLFRIAIMSIEKPVDNRFFIIQLHNDKNMCIKLETVDFFLNIYVNIFTS